jgi:hyaluronan synthase
MPERAESPSGRHHRPEISIPAQRAAAEDITQAIPKVRADWREAPTTRFPAVQRLVEVTRALPRVPRGVALRRPNLETEVTVKANPWLVAFLFAVVGAAAAAWFSWRGAPSWSIYGIAVSVLLGAKLLLSLLPPPRWEPAPEGKRVCVVVPIFNEDPEILARCLASIDAQTYQPTHVRIIDDGSSAPEAHNYAIQWAMDRANARVIFQHNAGKREAMGQAFRELGEQVDLFVCVDSDTVLEPEAIREGLAPFSDPRTAAVTGTVVALNQDRGLLPGLLDLRYVNAFLYERAAYSRLGSVLCVCGSLAIWRADIVRAHLDDFLGQQFLGEPCSYGDDRHLTNLSLLHGRVVLAHKAIARTAVPEKGGHLIRQQVRWGRSFFRESLWALRNLGPKRAAWWLSALESVSWAGFTVGMMLSLFVLPAISGQAHWLDYLGWVFLAGYGRSVHVFSVRRTSWARWRQAAIFLLAPAYGMIHVLVLLPLRLYSLATLRATSWGTRSGGVEVAETA